MLGEEDGLFSTLSSFAHGFLTDGYRLVVSCPVTSHVIPHFIPEHVSKRQHLWTQLLVSSIVGFPRSPVWVVSEGTSIHPLKFPAGVSLEKPKPYVYSSQVVFLDICLNSDQCNSVLLEARNNCICVFPRGHDNEFSNFWLVPCAIWIFLSLPAGTVKLTRVW